MYILGISGKCGVGKNFLTENYIVPEIIKLNSRENKVIVPYFFSFGSFVKSELYSKDSTDTLSYNNLFLEKTPKTRLLLQNYATENGRDFYRKDMWIRHLEIWIQIHVNNIQIINKHLHVKIEPLFVIEDVRFENEYNFIKKQNGILILVQSPKRNLQRIKKENTELTNIHISEKGIEHLDFDYVINNDPENSIKVVFEIQSFIRSYLKDIKTNNSLNKSFSFDSSITNFTSFGKNEINEILYHSSRH